jgi:hypothetical protein
MSLGLVVLPSAGLALDGVCAGSAVAESKSEPNNRAIFITGSNPEQNPHNRAGDILIVKVGAGRASDRRVWYPNSKRKTLPTEA